MFARLEHMWQHRGLDCHVLLNSHGYRTGYVRVDEGHPYYGKGIDDPLPYAGAPERPADLDRVPLLSVLVAALDENKGADWLTGSMQGQLEVHGGVTFSDMRTIEEFEQLFPERPTPPPGWYVGFDCGHAFDEPDLEAAKDIMDPKYYELRKDLERRTPLFNMYAHRWPTEAVVKEVELLADQLAEIAAAAKLLDQLKAD